MQFESRPLWTGTTACASKLKVSLRAAPGLPSRHPTQPELLLPRDARHGILTQPCSFAYPGRCSEASRPAAAVALPRPGGPPRLEGEAALRATEQLRRELPYPPEAIERGLQGEALVLLFLDASGNAIAARLESSSGHALLDDAAVRAARTLRSLPDSAPREPWFPCVFACAEPGRGLRSVVFPA